ncbi:MAG: DNA translocase FtsK [Oscillospiraceae bacterium]|nr:DNA translocase FtsK [Oscillospiraceae bacterium]
MAEKKSTKRPASGARRGGASRNSAKKPAPKTPVHREIGAAVCLFLGVFLTLGCFDIQGLFIQGLSQFSRGMVGGGAYILPFSCLLAFLILLLHGGRPVRLRLLCAFLLPVSIGALVQLVGGSRYISWGGGLVKVLYQGGISGTAGGLAAGFLALLFETVFSRVGAVILFILLFLLELLGSLNMTVISLIRAIRNRPRLPKYEAPDEEPPDPAEILVNHVAARRIERVEKREEKRRTAQQFDFDIPVDEPPMPVREPSKPQKRPIQSPDEYLLEKMGKTAPKTSEPEPEETLSDIGEVTETPEAHLAAVIDFPVPEPEPEPPVRVLPEPIPFKPRPQPEPLAPPVPETPKSRKEAAQKSAEEVFQEFARSEPVSGEYVYPPAALLRPGTGGNVDGTEEMRENTERLNATLQSFNIDAHIVNVTRGPSVTRYELELDRGVKLSKVTNLADDIALSLGATGVRISAIPDKISVVGIEVPNRLVSTVLARDVIDSQEFVRSKSRISFAVGKDIGGNRIIGDIAKLPHMLIAGTTGSGKSVCMNSLIISLLYKARPDEVRLIMVDPKMVELGVYNGIPHLLIPVVTDPKKAAGALQWAVTEMMRRYRMMADAGVRDLDSYNKLAAAQDDGERVPMEKIVVVIDELADLMLVAAKEVEESICRIAQMGRASGIHLVIATQRPSADVITGLMKANIPSRIAFAVASAMESRIILDTQGAEKLVGKGDMLYAPLGQGKPKRVQGCFITDDEVQDVVNFIKRSTTPNYSEEVQAQIEQKAEQGGKGGDNAPSQPESDDEADELLTAAVEVILETGQASVSMLQRRLKLGYARAARIVDEMEERGIVGPFEGSKPRQLLITREQWAQMQGGAPAPAEPVEEELE